MDLIERLNDAAGQGIEPDLTILLDCPVETGFERIRSRYQDDSGRSGRGAPDRMEAEDRAFHERIRKGYLRLAEGQGHRIRVVNAAEGVEEVHERVMGCLHQALKERE